MQVSTGAGWRGGDGKWVGSPKSEEGQKSLDTDA